MWRRSLFVFLCLTPLAFAAAPTGQVNKDAPKSKKTPKPGTYYNYGQVGVKKMEVDGSTINMSFKPVNEQFHWCPGINVEKVAVENSKKQVTVVTFVRCKTSEDCGVDKQARIGKRLIRTVSFNTNGLDVFVREGEKYRRIHKAPDPEPEVKKKTAKKGVKKTKKGAKKTGKKKSEQKVAPNYRGSQTLYPTKEHGINRRVSNFHYRQSN